MRAGSLGTTSTPTEASSRECRYAGGALALLGDQWSSRRSAHLPQLADVVSLLTPFPSRPAPHPSRPCTVASSRIRYTRLSASATVWATSCNGSPVGVVWPEPRSCARRPDFVGLAAGRAPPARLTTCRSCALLRSVAMQRAGVACPYLWGARQGHRTPPTSACEPPSPPHQSSVVRARRSRLRIRASAGRVTDWCQTPAPGSRAAEEACSAGEEWQSR
jgi:hypothetical protein